MPGHCGRGLKPPPTCSSFSMTDHRYRNRKILLSTFPIVPRHWLQIKMLFFLTIENVVVANGNGSSIRITITIAAVRSSLRIERLLVHVRMDVNRLHCLFTSPQCFPTRYRSADWKHLQ